MSLQNILVVATSCQKTNENTIRSALKLASHHNAHLTGVFVVPPLDIPVYFNAPPPQSLVEAQSKASAEALDQSSKLFETLTKKYGWENRVTWRSFEGNPIDIISINARYADITIMGQQKSVEEDYIYSPYIEDIIMSSGKPVLVIPETGIEDQIFSNRVLVAWDSSREAARAVSDSMLFLEKAEFVTVCVIDANNKPPLSGETAAIQLTEHLARHQISAQANYEIVEKESVAEALIRKVKDTNSDMIVMGGYGESKLRQILMGSTTGYIMKNMTVPVLFSH